jgi:hypothetical protein
VSRLGIAFAALLLLAAPSALLAQSTPAQPPNVRPIPPVRPHPHPSGGYRPRPNRPNQYPVVIDGSVINRFLATPSPAPKHKPTPHPHNNGQDVFETHSTTDNQ